MKMSMKTMTKTSGRIQLAMVLAVVLPLSACVTGPTYNKNRQPTVVLNEQGVPNFHRVERGETVSQISGRYGINWRDVARLNRLDSNNTIYTGQWLMLWRASASQPKPKPSPDVSVSTKPNPKLTVQVPPPITQPTYPSTVSAGNHAGLVGSTGLMQFVYPVAKHSKIVRHFGEVRQVNGTSARAEGMWFDGNVGDAIVASRAGTVIYADANNVPNASISIRHADGFTSEYRFIKDTTVKQGQNVSAGQRIASMKQSSGVVVMEFRIQKGSMYIDPESVLR